MAVESGRYGNERQTLTAMRGRLMAYCKGFPGAKELRQRICQVDTVVGVESLAEMSLSEPAVEDSFFNAEPHRSQRERKALVD